MYNCFSVSELLRVFFAGPDWKGNAKFIQDSLGIAVNGRASGPATSQWQFIHCFLKIWRVPGAPLRIFRGPDNKFLEAEAEAIKAPSSVGNGIFVAGVSPQLVISFELNSIFSAMKRRAAFAIYTKTSVWNWQFDASSGGSPPTELTIKKVRTLP